MTDGTQQGLLEETALPAGQAAVDREHHRVRAEIAAFQEFADRIADLHPQYPRQSHPDRTAGGTVTTASAARVENHDRSRPAEAIQSAYRETVFAVDHWQATYTEDTVAESMAAEFSSDLVGTLLAPSSPPFSALVRDRLRAEVAQAVADREASLAALTTEATHLSTLGENLESIIAQVRAVEHATESDAAHAAQLEEARRSLDALAHSHQEYLHSRTSDTESLFTELVYADLETPYPGLSAIAAVGTLTDRVERRLSAGRR